LLFQNKFEKWQQKVFELDM